MNPLHRKTFEIANNLYEAEKVNVTENTDSYVTIHYAPSMYTGDLASAVVRCGFYEKSANDNGSFFLNMNPMSSKFKQLCQYRNNVAFLPENFDDFFATESSGGGMASEEIIQYIDTKVSQAVSNVIASDSIYPVSDTSELAAFSNLVDKKLIFVESANAIYSYDSESIAEVDGENVVSTSTGIGRWVKTNNPDVISGGIF